METERIRILLVEDDEADLMAVERLVKQESLPYELVTVGTVAEAIAQLQQGGLDLVLIDYKLPDGFGLEVQKHAGETPCIFITGVANQAVAVQAMKAGAYDFLIKDDQREYLQLLPEVVRSALERQRTRAQVGLQQRMINSLSEMVLLLNEVGDVVFANAAVESILGYEPEEVLGSGWWELVVPDAAQRRRWEMHTAARARGDRPPISSDLKLQRKDGSQIWTSWVESRGPGGGLICVGRDITARVQAEDALQRAHDDLERRVEERTAELAEANAALQEEIAERVRAEEELRESHRTVATILESINADVYVADMDTYEIMYMNKHMRDSFGNDLVGKTCYEVFRREERICGHCTNDLLLDENGQPTGVYVWEGQNPVTGRWYTNADRAIRWHDGRMVRLQIATDITERKRMQEELLKAQKLESVGILAGGIAHDFNNILTGIMGNIGLAKMYAKPEGRVYQRLAEAERASMRAKELTRQLLTFSKGGAPVKKTASIAGLIADSCKFAVRGSNVRCEFSIPDDLWPVELDEGQMSQVINNLVINAVQAMPEGGTIRVCAENVTVDEERMPALRAGRYVKVTVEDQGIGISEEHLPKIFDPYFTTKQKGSGLGLAISYAVVKNHDGLITVGSELGAGTVFSIYLPASHKAIPDRRVVEEVIPVGEGRVLVMDDEQVVREVATEMLSHLGYEAETARDGAEAIALYEKAQEAGQPYDAVIMDLTVPGGLGGKEAIRQLREIDPEVRAIVSSGYSNDPVMANFRQYGFNGVVSKPYRVKDLGETLHKVIA